MTTLLRSSEAAEKLDISEHQLYTKTREGIIPSVRIGRILRWSDEAIEEFIRSGGQGFACIWRKES